MDLSRTAQYKSAQSGLLGGYEESAQSRTPGSPGNDSMTLSSSTQLLLMAAQMRHTDEEKDDEEEEGHHIAGTVEYNNVREMDGKLSAEYNKVREMGGNLAGTVEYNWVRDT